MTSVARNASTVSVLGLGAMGAALAAAFLAAGHTVAVWNRSPEKTDDLVSKGAHAHRSIDDAAAASQLVVVCLSDYAAVKEVLSGIADFEDRTVVDVSSGTAADAQEMAERLTERNARYLDGAILDGPSAIGADNPTAILYSGTRSAFDEHEVLLSALGSGYQYLGEDAGRACLYDSAGLTMGWSVLNGFLQGAALLQSSGADPREAVSIIAGTAKTVVEWLPEYAKQLHGGHYSVLDANISTYAAGMTNLLTELETAGVDASIPLAWHALAERAARTGDGDQGYAAMIKQFRTPPPQ